MSEQYYGVTIGPVFDTISAAKSPAGLWCASYLFSWISREFCKKLLESGVKETDIFSPFIAKDAPARKDGVGCYPDRMYFRADSGFEKALGELIAGMKSAVAAEFGKSLTNLPEARLQDFFDRYLLFYEAHMDVDNAENQMRAGEKNPIPVLNRYLNALELSRPFVPEVSLNPIARLFGVSDDEVNQKGDQAKGKNESIKRCFLLQKDETETCQLRTNPKDSDSDLKQMKDIAARGQGEHGGSENVEWKRYRYCAVVNADGDSMGKVLDGFPPEKTREFSKACLDYGAEVSKKISDYGGVTIYAGGDDLLFLAPLDGTTMTAAKECSSDDSGKGKTETIFDLCEEISDIFSRSFKKICKGTEHSEPTVSFGISAHYYRFPLYESQRDAKRLLEKAKEHGKNKNSLAFRLQKASGIPLEFIAGNQSETLKQLKGLLNQSLELETKDDQTGRLLHSVIYKLDEFKSLFAKAQTLPQPEENQLQPVFQNIFDSDVQKNDVMTNYLRSAQSLLRALGEENTQADQEKTSEVFWKNRIDTLGVCLRIAKFYTERAEEE